MIPRKHLVTKVRQTWRITALSLVAVLGGCNSAPKLNLASSAIPGTSITNSNTTNTSTISNSVAAVGERPLVVATDTITCGLTHKIAVDTVDLKCLAAPDAKSHKSQLQMEDGKAIEQARLILYRRYNAEPRLSKLIQASLNPAPKVAVDEFIVPQLAANSKTVSAQESRLTLPDGIKMTEAIDQSLSQLKPDRAAIYAANAQKLKDELVQLDSWSQAEIASLSVAQQQSLSAHELLAYLHPSPWPHINAQARLARIPVLMYHDILPKKLVFFDMTPQEFEQQLRSFRERGITPISLEQLVTHLRTGLPLPGKPVLLTFDDGYESAYKYVFPLLKQYGYPAVFSIYTLNVGKNTGRDHVTWAQLREMIASPLVTIASHSVTHPMDLRALPTSQLRLEVMESKRILEAQLGIPIQYFTYPSGKYDERVTDLLRQAGYRAALTMNDLEDRFAEQSKDLLAIDRIGSLDWQSAITRSWGGMTLSR